MLPAGAADAEPDDLVAAEPAEQPDQRQGAQQLDGVLAAGRAVVDVAVLEVEPGPQQFRPHVIGDHPRVGADQRADAARGGQRAGRVEPAGDRSPFLAVAEELACPGQQPGLGPRHQRLADTLLEGVAGLDVVPDPEPVDRGDPGGA